MGVQQWRQGWLAEPPRMAHGDAERMIALCEATGMSVVPWQAEFLRQLETSWKQTVGGSR